jgi:predicted ATPase
LFVERARASSPRFALDDRTLAAVSSLTRRLDGIPLAIELAAARVEALGVEAIAARLDDRLDLLTSGRRTALPRQRTLRATLDWSYDLLSEDERLAVRRLSIFAGGFTPEAAGAVVAVPPVADTIVELVAKSLVNAKVDGAAVRFRMLETTRAYALEKLIESDERGDVAQRHAEYYRDLFRHAAAESAMRPASEWWAAYGIEINNLRAALDWAFSPAGDPSVGVALTVASTPHWFRYSGIEEYRRRLEQALASLQHGSGEDARNELELVLARAQLLRFENTGAQALRQAWAGALRLAEAFGEPRYRARALWGLWGAVVRSGEPRAGLALAEQFSFLAQGAADVADRYVAGRMMGVSLHYLGDQINARRHIERMLDSCPNPAPASHSIGFSYDNRETSRAMLTRVLWLQGFPDQAAQLSASIFADVKALNHQPTLRYVLSWALCPIAILAGDLKTAESFLDLLSDPSADQWLDMTAHLTRCLRGVLLLRQDDAGVGLRQLEEGLEDLDRTGSSQYNYFLGALAEGLGQAGRLAEARAAIEKALARAVRNEELWCFAELSRVKGMLVLAEDSADAESEAEALFLQGVESARGQGALSWELRCATSLAGLRRDQGHRREAREALAPVLDRFTEGFATPDLRAAKSLLSKLS